MEQKRVKNGDLSGREIRQRLVLFYMFAACCVAFGVFYSTAQHGTFSIPVLTAAAFIFFSFSSVILYAIRETFKAVYGAAEIAFALFAAVTVLLTYLNVEVTSLPKGYFVAAVGIFGAMYVVVRGLDNIAKGADEHQKRSRERGERYAEALWRGVRIFMAFIGYKKPIEP